MGRDNNLTELALGAGLTIPTLYFGTQVVASWFFPDYSFFTRDASALGAVGAPYPFIFNYGSILVGIVVLISTWGYYRALKYLEVHRALRWGTTLGMILFGLGSINAGLFPLPDPRHMFSLVAMLSMGMFALPVLLPAALWKQADIWIFKALFALVICIVIILLPVNSGLVQRIAVSSGTELPAFQHFINNYHGLIQRVVAFTIVVPLGAGSFLLRRKIRE